MKRAALAGLAAFAAFVAPAAAQLVPVSTCHAALPCSIPYGLRPADAVQHLGNANGGPGNAALSLHLNDRFEMKLAKPVSEDPSEYAARLFVLKNPVPLKKATLAAPTPNPTPAPGKD